MSAGPSVLLMQLSERTSAKGNRYLAGWLGKASVVAFRGDDDKHGNPGVGRVRADAGAAARGERPG